MGGNVIIWGAGGHAKVVADILLCTGFSLAGLIDDVTPTRRAAPFAEALVLGGERELIQVYAAGVHQGIIGFGDNTRRLAAAATLKSYGFELIRAIHPSAILSSSASVGPGSMIAAGAVVNPSAVLGKCVIVNTNAAVDHDCIIGDGAHIGPGVTVAGTVQIGERAWIGAGATVIDGKRIGAGAIVGAGSVVIDDVPERVLVVGIPARVIRELDRATEPL